MMTDEERKHLAALAEAATPGRWIAEPGMGVRLADYTPICMAWSETCEPVNVDANMAFIAAARQAVPELLAESAELRQQLAQAKLERDAARDAVVGLQGERSALRSLLEDERQRTGHANRWRNTAIEEANTARADAADLRRQLAEATNISPATGRSR